MDKKPIRNAHGRLMDWIDIHARGYVYTTNTYYAITKKPLTELHAAWDTFLPLHALAKLEGDVHESVLENYDLVMSYLISSFKQRRRWNKVTNSPMPYQRKTYHES